MKEVLIVGFLLSAGYLVDAGNVSRIELPIHGHAGCGGHDLRVTLENGHGNSCSTARKGEFPAGETLSWSGQDLGECRGFTIDDSTGIKLHTDSSNRFCVVGSMTISTTSGEPYFSRIANYWRNNVHNHETFKVFQRGVKRLLLQNFHDDQGTCRSSQISVKLVDGSHECTVQTKPQIMAGALARWEGDQLGECTNFITDDITSAYILVNSDDQDFCPILLQVIMNDGVTYQAFIQTSLQYGYVYNRGTNNDAITGFEKSWPLNHGNHRTPIQRQTCPSPNDPNVCPIQDMTAYEVRPTQTMNCAFECGHIKDTLYSTTFDVYNGTGQRCMSVDYSAVQFKWCCRTKRISSNIPKCSDVNVRDSEFRVTQQETNEVFSEEEDPECPDYGCPIENVEAIIDTAANPVQQSCDAGCDYVKSGNSDDPTSGITCQDTRRARKPKKFCCNSPNQPTTLVSCDALRSEMSRRTPRVLPTAVCPPGEDFFTVAGKCYKVEKDPKTNNDARENCRQIFGGNGKLFEPKDDNNYDQVIAQVDAKAPARSRLWIGIETKPDAKYFSGGRLYRELEKHWATGEPNNWQGSEECVEYRTSDYGDYTAGKWNDGNCSWRRRSICEKNMH